MIENWLLIIGASIIIIWGVAHILPVKNVISGFGNISLDNKRVVTMGWIAEGLFLIYLGVTVIAMVLMDGLQSPVFKMIIGLNGMMLLILSIVSLFTGVKTSVLPMKLCPVIKSIVALMYFIGVTLV